MNIKYALVITIGLFAVWFSGVAAYKYYGYSKLNSRTMAKEIAWSIKEINDEKYYPEAHYRYVVDGKEYEGDTVLSDFPYRNSWATQQANKENDAKRWAVWYDISDNGYSSLVKQYPTKEMAYAAIMWALVFYFMWLSHYVTKKQF